MRRQSVDPNMNPLAMSSSEGSNTYQPTTQVQFSNIANYKPADSDFTISQPQLQSFASHVMPVDPLQLLNDQFVSRCRTTPLDVNTVQLSIDGMQTFARHHAWSLVVNTSSKLLSRDQNIAYSGGTLTLVMKLRFEGLFRLKMFDELILEVNKIIIYEDLRLSQHIASSDFTVNTVIDCDLSIAMKLLLAEVKALMGRYDESLEQLYVLRAVLQTHENPNTVPETSHYVVKNAAFWIWRIRSAIVNAATRQRQWRISLTELLSMLKDLQNISRSKSSNVSALLLKPKIVLLCRTARAFLQMGNIDSAVKFYDVASREFIQTKQLDVLSHQIESIEDQVIFTKSLVKFSLNEYEEAMEGFDKIISKEALKQQKSTSVNNAFSFFTSTPSSLPVSSNADNTVDGIDFSYLSTVVITEESLLPAAISNYAICALNLRNIKESVSKLEVLIQQDPAKYLNDAIVFNLCTLYDLTSSPDLGTNKKKVLHNISQLYHVGEPIINWKSFRLS